MKSNLISKLIKAGSVKQSTILSESPFFKEKEFIKTDLPILNIAFSGKLDGGLVSGLTVFAGQSKSYKTLLGLYCMKSYMDKFPDAICLFYDSEFGVTPEYLQENGIDTERVIHIPVEHIEQLKFDIVKRLEMIEKNDRVFIFIDSIGNLASKKEIDDAIDEKSVADMTRAKQIRSLFRIITPHLTIKNLPCIAICHVYSTQELYSKTVVSGGTSIIYSSNQVFIITRSQEKDGTDLVGFNFTINIEKSRFVREKSKLEFQVKFDGGISKYSGLMDLALEGKFVVKPVQGWFCKVNQESGEMIEPKMRLKDTFNEEFWDSILADENFNKFIEKKYKLGLANLNDASIEEELSVEDEGE